MRASTKWILGIGLVALLAGAGFVAAQATSSPSGANAHGKGRPGPFAVFRVCKDDSMTVGQCKELVKEKAQQRIDAAYQKCLQNHEQSFCDQKKAAMEQRVDQATAPSQ